MRGRILSGLCLVMFALVGCSEPQEQMQQTRAGKAQKSCYDCVATNYPAGTDSFSYTTCTAASACVNGDESILHYAANRKCKAINTNECKGKCEGERKCMGILDPDSNWKALTVDAVPGAPCPGAAGQINCKITITVPAGQLMDCDCSCNP